MCVHVCMMCGAYVVVRVQNPWQERVRQGTQAWEGYATQAHKAQRLRWGVLWSSLSVGYGGEVWEKWGRAMSSREQGTGRVPASSYDGGAPVG